MIFAFLRFFVILYEFSKSLNQRVKVLRIYLQQGPSEDLKFHNHTLSLCKDPWKYLGPCNVVVDGV
jgi:hypothetical protein